MNGSTWFMVVAGAVFLCIEAYQRYRVLSGQSPYPGHPVLRDITISEIGTERELATGFAFYAFFYLVIYFFFIFSGEVFDLVVKHAAEATLIGPVNLAVDNVGNIFKAEASGYGRPLFIASTMIALSSIGALAKIEIVMRRMAHKIAGLPRGVHGVIDRLEQLRIEGLDKFIEGEGEFASEFKEAFLSKVPDRASGYPSLHPKPDMVIDDLKIIDVLAPALFGIRTSRWFPSAVLAMQDKRLREQEDSLGEFRRTLDKAYRLQKSLAHHPGNGDAAAAEAERANHAGELTKIWDDVAGQASQLADSLQALFAVLFLRNDRFLAAATFGGAEDPCTQKRRDLAERIRDPYSIPVNALIVSTVLTLVTMCIFEYIHLESRTGGQVMQMIGNVTTIVVSLALAGGVALMLVQIEYEGGRWPEWHLNRPPIARLIWTAIIPAFVFLVSLTFLDFLLFTLDLGAFPNQAQLTNYLSLKWLMFLTMPILGLIGALSIIILANQYDHLSPVQTVVTSLICSAFLWIWGFLTVIAAAKPIDTLPQSAEIILQSQRICLPITMLLVAFALVLEFWEGSERSPGTRQRTSGTVKPKRPSGTIASAKTAGSMEPQEPLARIAP